MNHVHNFSPCNKKERVMGIEPTYPAWKAGVLPLNYTRIFHIYFVYRFNVNYLTTAFFICQLFFSFFCFCPFLPAFPLPPGFVIRYFGGSFKLTEPPKHRFFKTTLYKFSGHF